MVNVIVQPTPADAVVIIDNTMQDSIEANEGEIITILVAKAGYIAQEITHTVGATDETVDVEITQPSSFGTSDVAIYGQYSESVDGRKRFPLCTLAKMPEYGKGLLANAVEEAKRISTSNPLNETVYEDIIENFFIGIAYLYKRMEEAKAVQNQ